MGFKKISQETREYFWFALALMLILIGSRARADTPPTIEELEQSVRCDVNYTVTRFDGGAAKGADRDDEKAFFTRFQVAF